MNVDRSIESVKHLIYHAATPIFLNLDGHPVQESECVKDYVASNEGRLRLFILPPYSPNLNPDEWVWENVKARVAKRAVTSKEDLMARVISALRRLQKLTGIIQGFFRHAHRQYIGDAQLSA